MGMIFLWNGSRKPNWDSITEDIVEIGGRTIKIASFETDPFESIDEYYLYKDATDKYIKKTGGRPVSLKDYEVLKKIIEENRKRRNMA